VIDNPATFNPIRHRYNWRYGLVDGSPPTARARFPTKLPRPPKTRQERGDGGSSRQGGRGDTNEVRVDRRPGRESTGACDWDTLMRDAVTDQADRSGRDNRSRDYNARANRGDRDERDQQARSRERPRGNSQYACKSFFSRPFRRHDDDKDDGGYYDHSGHGGLSEASFWGFDEC
jgi:hypothetical protein